VVRRSALVDDTVLVVDQPQATSNAVVVDEPLPMNDSEQSLVTSVISP
jgi:hypothetical protein